MQKKIIDVLRKHQSFVVTMHVHPDPDAMGAALSMALFLRSIGKDVRVLNEDAAPSWLRFMPKVSLYKQYTGREKFVPEVVVVLDCGDLERVGRVKELIGKDTIVVNIDHHVTNVRFGDYNHVGERYSSTCEILFQFLKAARCHFTKDIAVLLYLGILTDTGSFGFDCTGSHTHEVIAELLKFNVSVSDLYRQVYETMPRGDLKPFLSAMNRLELCCDGQVACLTMTRSDEALFSGEFDLREKVFSFLRSVKGLEVIVIVTEKEKGKVRINLRSRNGVNVAKIAEKFGGGGHKKASGGFWNGSVAEAKARVLAEIGRVL